MSLIRFVCYSTIMGGCAALLGWLLAESLLMRDQEDRGLLILALVGALLGAFLGAGLNVVAGMTNTRLKNLIMRVPAGLLGGGIGGAAGSLAGQMIYSVGLPRGLGFILLGLGVGIVEGVYERSPGKVRNGAIGGLVGGLAGGLLFDPISSLVISGAEIASRPAAFLMLGICIGTFVSVVQVVLKEASLRVLDGYGVGREIILGNPVTVLGRADHLRLPFLGRANADLEPEHLRIVRQSDGSFTIEDNNSRLGVSVNHESVHMPRMLQDGDVIRFGPNLVRFNQRKAKEAKPVPQGSQPSCAPPPPPPSRPRSASGAPASPAGLMPPPAPPWKKASGPPPPPPPKES